MCLRPVPTLGRAAHIEGMTNTPVSPAAASAREAARATDGKFGTQAKAEADIDLQVPSAAAAPAPFRNKAVHDQIGEMRAALWRQERELDAYAEKLAAKGIAHEVLAQFPTATRISVEMEHFDDGSAWRPQAILDADGTVLADMLDEVETSDGAGNLSEDFYTGIDCEHDSMNTGAGIVHLGHLEREAQDVSYPYYLDLQAAAALDDTVPVTLLDPHHRPLTADEQVRLVELASYHSDDLRLRLGQDGVRGYDDPSEYFRERSELIEAEAAVAPLRPGETVTGYAAGWAVQDADSFPLSAVHVEVKDGKPTVVAATGADGELLEDDELAALEEEHGLSEVLGHIGFTELTDDQLAASGITHSGTGYRIPNRSY